MGAPPDSISLRVPCCARSVRAAQGMAYAPLVLRRTCPKCRIRWQVTLTPIGEAAMGIWLHEATWIQLPS